MDSLIDSPFDQHAPVAMPSLDCLSTSHWITTTLAGDIVTPYVRLLPDGRIGGEGAAEAPFWSYEDGLLRIRDAAGRAILVFDRAARRDASLSLFSTAGGFVLSQMTPPHTRDRPHLATRLKSRRPRSSRPNLIVLRANHQSLHPRWARDIADVERSWDLAISWYGTAADYRRLKQTDDFSEFSAFQPEERKFQAIRSLLLSHPELLEYERFMFPDDDLDMSWSDINTAFLSMRAWDLRIAQPALRDGSHVSYDATRQDRAYHVRFTNMVEVMIPMMARDILVECLGTFGLTDSAFGIDFVWPKITGVRPHQIGIIDDVAVLHTRPIATNYDIRPAYKEGDALCAIYGKHEWFQINVRGGMVRTVTR